MNALLDAARAAGAVEDSDIAITDRLIRLCGEPVDDVAALAVTLAVRAVRAGSTCLALTDLDALGTDDAAGGDPAGAAPPAGLPSTDEIVAAVRTCPLVVGSTGGPLRPLVLRDSDDGPLLYLAKYFQQEQVIRGVLEQRSADTPAVALDAVSAAVDAAFADSPDSAPRQRLATVIAATRRTAILTGGPGTGKTYTVARILAVLNRIGDGRLHVAVCAPTGRAVAQLQASLDGLARRSGGDRGTADRGVHAVTVNGLLKWRPGSVPRHGPGNRLPHDVVVVDETSMLSATAMSHLLRAIRPDTRLILVGDPHQLASVEAGAVLADLVEREPSGAPLPGPIAVLADAARIGAAERPRLADGIVTLTDNYRNPGPIAAVAAAVNAGDADAVLELLADGAGADGGVDLVEFGDPGVRADIVAWGTRLGHAARTGDIGGALDALDAHRVLCAHREGTWGVGGWLSLIAGWLSEVSGRPPVDPQVTRWEPGVPVLVRRNEPRSRVFNGDCGVVIRQDTDADTDVDPLAVAFRRTEDSSPVVISPARLPETMWAYAMTIHRSQGSQFGTVTVVLPPADSPLLTRELLYTAITRARDGVRIVGTPDELRAAVNRRVHRASGL
ncbi:MAG: exodeoxyribonuclease V subunit alpha, partial [Gordonia sp. (in: high G+C Gram-positive bacteria)]